VVDPGFDIEWADRVDDNDGILMNTGNGIDQVIAVGPSSQIVAVSILQSQRYALQSQIHINGRVCIPYITVNNQEPLSRVRLDEHESGIGSKRNTPRVSEAEIVEVPINRGPVLSRTSLNCFDWGDQVREVCDSRAPAHGQDTVGSTTVREAVGAACGRGSVGTYHGNAPGLLEWKGISSVLQEDDAGSGDLANDFPVVVSDVDMFVLGVVQWVPGIEVGLWESGVLANEVPSGKNSAGIVGEERKTSHQGTRNTYRTAMSSTRASGMVPLLT